ncbi:Mini-ribonuclease 3 [Alicyclobacillus mali (ex Roth et al. 2021)]|uniref:Mini-ribonuclease 3 n=1 Tax=Alicyclobacillus mali (ex Roth et al. 2021) TaxID=1123961 RepID=UPI00082A06CE|nr:ribonuclease III domain-containing protein [Alicyclobacillus mali (ex Roth et al. 2021)]MCL6488999.1 ribonuclease III [Alicyclobacillus mali (ex Roth et al. 2021)]
MKRNWRVEDVSPLALAFLGDAVWEIYARNHCLNLGILRPHDLQRQATRYVSAASQAEALRLLEPMLTDAERDVIRRGRNQKSAHTRRNVDVVVYRLATGFEALVGYLYATGERERLDEIAARALAALDAQNDETGEP